jgi:hypothetical protein
LLLVVSNVGRTISVELAVETQMGMLGLVGAAVALGLLVSAFYVWQLLAALRYGDVSGSDSAADQGIYAAESMDGESVAAATVGQIVHEISDVTGLAPEAIERVLTGETADDSSEFAAGTSAREAPNVACAGDNAGNEVRAANQ